MTIRSLAPAPRITARRGVIFLAAALMIGAAPFVARAFNDEPAAADTTPGSETGSETGTETGTETGSESQVSVRRATIDDGTRPTDRGRKPVFQHPVEAAQSEPVLEAAPSADLALEPAVDPAVLILTNTYEWNERGARVEALQQILGVTTDGWYGRETARAHRTALEIAELATDDVPAPVLPPGPSEDEWAALRQCESGGDYSITNPSGKYRGAYQFDRSTWNSVAERHAPQLVSVDPARASRADQDAMALALYSERGARPWPQCGRHLR